MLSDEYRYKILKRLEVNPEISQRELAGELGISLGRVNYCIQALVEKGLVKANNFRNSKNKKGYAYLLMDIRLNEIYQATKEVLEVESNFEELIAFAGNNKDDNKLEVESILENFIEQLEDSVRAFRRNALFDEH